jgi:hypothetical protein
MVAFCSASEISVRCFARRKKRTLDPNEIVDMLLVIEKAAPHLYLWAELGKHSGTRKPKEIDQDYREAAGLAALAAEHRHAKLSAMKLAGDPTNPVRMIKDKKDDQSTLARAVDGDNHSASIGRTIR